MHYLDWQFISGLDEKEKKKCNKGMVLGKRGIVGSSEQSQ